MEKKYKLLTDDTIQHDGRTLYRIQALRDFYIIRAGALGGYIEKEANLSHYGDCWVYYGGKVYDDAKVLHDALIYGKNTQLRDLCEVSGYATVSGNAIICNRSLVNGYALICDNVVISDSAWICGSTKIHNNVKVLGNAKLSGDAIFKGDIEMTKSSDYITIGQFGNQDRYVTYTPQNNMVAVGCFYDTLDKFKEAVDKKYEGQGSYYTCIKMLEVFKQSTEK